MSEKFKHKYRIQSARLQSWDYSSIGMYFISICTANREHFFGEIEQGEMQLNTLGQCAEQEWLKTFEIRPDMNLQMGAYVVMPNHFHAIIIIGDNPYNTHFGDHTTPNNRFGPQSKNLASIVRGFKSAVTTTARKMGDAHFGWQSRYHDHIIRNEKAFKTITQYIINNPKTWDEDQFKNQE